MENYLQSLNELILHEDNIYIILHVLHLREQIHQKHQVLLLVNQKVYELQRNPVSNLMLNDLPILLVRDLQAKK